MIMDRKTWAGRSFGWVLVTDAMQHTYEFMGRARPLDHDTTPETIWEAKQINQNYLWRFQVMRAPVPGGKRRFFRYIFGERRMRYRCDIR